MKNKQSDYSSKEKRFDCVVFKQKMQELSWKRSGAKTMSEYVKYINSLPEDEFKLTNKGNKK